jgi:uncharacterized protein
MQLETIEHIIATTRPALEAAGVTHVALFGSRVRGDHRPDSDLDVLIEVDNRKRFSLLDLVGVQRILTDAVGLPTQATMRRSLSLAFGNSIEREIRDVF